MLAMPRFAISKKKTRHLAFFKIASKSGVDCFKKMRWGVHYCQSCEGCGAVHCGYHYYIQCNGYITGV